MPLTFTPREELVTKQMISQGKKKGIMAITAF